MSNLGCFTCLSCGKVNPVKGHSYTNKYCNNSCQQEHQRRNKAFENVQKWKEAKEPQAWAKIPDWIKQYLISNRGHKCESCNNASCVFSDEKYRGSINVQSVLAGNNPSFV